MSIELLLASSFLAGLVVGLLINRTTMVKVTIDNNPDFNVDRSGIYESNAE